MTYHVDITLGSLTWSLTETFGVVTDGVRVLSGLTFGWAMSKAAIWPCQPSPMTAALAVTVPDFSELDINEGDALSIEVKADTGGAVIARFYGDVTDYQAAPRPGRPGVTLSVVAVDYTVRTAEIDGMVDIGPGSNFDLIVVEALWPYGGLGPGVSDTPPVGGVWTSPSRQLTLPISADRTNLRNVVDQLLLQAVNTTDLSRMIVSPFVDSGGLLAASPAGRYFTLDTIDADLETVDPDTDVWTIPGSCVRRDAITWGNTKGQTPGLFMATGWGGDVTNTADSPTGGTSQAIEAIPVNLALEADAQDVADFYASRAASDPWQITGITVEVSRAGIGADVPDRLFPDWKAGEGDLERSQCYREFITVTGVSPTRTPDASTTISGVLVGANCTISGGALTLDLAIRRRLPPPTD